MAELYAIFLRDHEIVAQIGIHDFERKAPQRLLLNVTLVLSRQGTGDSIGEVVDYDYIRREAGLLAACGHYELQETFCAALLARCRAQPGVLGVTVSTEKPEVYADSKGVGCLMSWAEETHRDEAHRLFALVRRG